MILPGTKKSIVYVLNIVYIANQEQISVCLSKQLDITVAQTIEKLESLSVTQIFGKPSVWEQTFVLTFEY